MYSIIEDLRGGDLAKLLATASFSFLDNHGFGTGKLGLAACFFGVCILRLGFRRIGVTFGG